jgi:alpha-galactosidase
VNMQHPAGQAYYDSLFQLYAEWQVDFVKVDDIIADGTDRGLGPYHAAEIEGIRRAIDRCGRPMVLSLSPGDAALTDAGHLKANANLWRISADFWDDWRKLKRMFSLCERWWPHRTPGAWPDADMLPLGRICKRGPKMPERDAQLTPDEAKVMLTLWCLFRSPLMIGGHLPETDATTVALLTNPEVLAVNQECLGGQPLRIAAEGTPVWVSDYQGLSEKAVGIFNLRDTACEVAIPLQELGFSAAVNVRDLWARCSLGRVEEKLRLELPPHSSALWRISRA